MTTFRVFWFFVLLGWSLVVWTAGDMVGRLQQLLDEMSSLQARFQQVVEVPAEGARYYSSGTFSLQKPGLFRWDYDEPAGQFLLADGKRLWFYDPELEQVSHREQQAALRGTPGQLLSGAAALTDHFQVTATGHDVDEVWLELKPLDPESQFTRIRLGIENDEVRSLTMADQLGQTSHLRFSQVVHDPVLPPELFRYKPPPGMDILGD